MIRHVVFVKFKANATQTDIDIFITEVNRLPNINPEVHNWVAGLAVDPRFHSGDFDWGLSCDLDNSDAMDRYMWHPAHLRTAPFAQAVVESMLSFDFNMEHEVMQGDASDKKAVVDPGARGRLVVPELRGRDLEIARQIAVNCGFRIVEPIERLKGHVWAPNRVVAVDPAAGTELPIGSPIRLTVSEGWSRVQLDT